MKKLSLRINGIDYYIFPFMSFNLFLLYIDQRNICTFVNAIKINAMALNDQIKFNVLKVIKDNFHDP